MIIRITQLQFRDHSQFQTPGTCPERLGALALFTPFALGVILAISVPSSLAGESREPPALDPRWYIGAGIGVNWAPNLDQEGWNREQTCYPTSNCFDADPVPEVSGYRWRYDIDTNVGPAFELTIGRIFDRARLELSFAQSNNDINQSFRGITYYDGTPIKERSDDTVVSDTHASINDLTIRTLSLNGYYDFPWMYRGVSPYVGVGLGIAFVEVSGLKFSAEYQDASGASQAYDPPLSFYNSRQNVNLSDTVFAWHLHTGADYRLNDRALLGLKLTYSMLDDFKDKGGYSLHPFHERDPDLTNLNTFKGAGSVTLMITVKLLSGH